MVSGNHAALPGGDDFVGGKRETPSVSKATQGSATPAGTEGLGCVADQKNIMFGADCLKRVVIRDQWY